MTSDKVKLVGLGIRIPEQQKAELDNAAWAEGVDLSELVREGIALVLEAVRQRHGGIIPEKPQRQPISMSPLPAETPKKRRK